MESKRSVPRSFSKALPDGETVSCQSCRRLAVRYSRFALSEPAFRKTLTLSAVAVVVLLAGIFCSLLYASFPALQAMGFRFFIGTTWDPVTGEFGALPFVMGTLLTSFLALVISTFFSLPIAIFLGEYYRYGVVSSLVKTGIELLAGIPSVIYGFWGLFFLVPIVRALQLQVGAPPYGVGILTASCILAIMIIPYSASLGREMIALVPSDLKEAALSLGATRFEMVRKVILPYARSGIFAGILLSLGRALGETMAVTMVIGNANFIPKSLFAPANTMASIIANEFTEATGTIYLASLIEIALLLFVVTMIINLVGKFIVSRLRVEV